MSHKQAKARTSKHQSSQDRKRKQRLNSILIWGGIGLGVLVIIGFLAFRSIRPTVGKVGEDVPVPANYETHVKAGIPPGPYPSDPPAGGVHYHSVLDPRFYQESDLASLSEHPGCNASDVRWMHRLPYRIISPRIGTAINLVAFLDNFANFQTPVVTHNHLVK